MPRAPARTDKLQQRISELRRLDPDAAASLGPLRDALESTTGALVAVAAEIAGDARLYALSDALVAAFARLCDEGNKRDPGCRGKVAAARALHAIEHWDDRVFVAGVRYQQHEGYGYQDSAAELRGICGLAHAHLGRPDALDVLALLLTDKELATRVAAARGLGDAGRPDASALLRYKLLTGDAEPEVLSACAEALLGLSGDAAHDFIVGLLADHDARAEVAALALGGARAPEALAALTRWCIGASSEQRHRVGYLAIALLRSDAGNAHLLDAIASHGAADAIAAARALATFREDAGVVALARAAAEDRDRATRAAINALFD